MKTSVLGYPRIGSHRELKFATEQYFRGSLSQNALEEVAASIRKANWLLQVDAGIDYIPSNDFSYYDQVLDTAVLLNAIPARFRHLGLAPTDLYFAMARGYQGVAGDVKALAMKKWFNTNYHYIVPELDDDTILQLAGSKPLDAVQEAAALGIRTKPVLVGAFTFLKLAKRTGVKTIEAFADDIALAYAELLHRLNGLGVAWVQIDEPALVLDLSDADIALFHHIYTKILPVKGSLKVLLQTYFGDINAKLPLSLPFDGIGLDFVEGDAMNLAAVNSLPEGMTLFAGVVNGKNIWKNQYSKTVERMHKLRGYTENIVLSTSCSLQHVPCTLQLETQLSETQRQHFAFAAEKLEELAALKTILQSKQGKELPVYIENESLFQQKRDGLQADVQAATAALTTEDFTRKPLFEERVQRQKEEFNLPLLPTTTIGSFPQTQAVRASRAAWKKGILSETDYQAFIREQTKACIRLQEDLGLDVLVHGEFERNDMVEFFGQQLGGFLFTQNAWVQSYGTRCVKPPIIWGDIYRIKSMTVADITYAQSLTTKPVKGMLTGPVTILNWSFPREDISLKTCAFQIALAIRQEVLDLEKAGIRIIQIDEAALREKLPLRKADWQHQYLDWAIPAFRLTHSRVRPETQIHTHMCYSEFSDILQEIDDMDADVITFEAARSDLGIVNTIAQRGFRTAVGPGVYDIHSPRVPSVSEISEILQRMLQKIDPSRLWVNPDCGLKTRGEAETKESLANLVAAALSVRKDLT